MLVGLYMIAGRFFWDAYVRSNTWYALTDDTALLLRSGLGGQLTSIFLPSCTSLSLDAQADKSGTIYFGPAPTLAQQMGNFGRTAAPNVPSFNYIPDVITVYEKCKAAQQWKQS
ncbi:MAG: hypothetical protein M3N19_04135 [Candidatus Eremiobacteraeota bacterium]|nr:hypothetical protein [Candidatus Eremiobacteraeota bacterium]